MRKQDKQAVGIAAAIAILVWWRSRSSKEKESGVVIDVEKTSGGKGSAHGESL